MGVLLSGWLLAAFFGGWLVLYYVLVGASSVPRSSHPLSSHPLSSRPRSLPKCCCRCHRPLRPSLLPHRAPFPLWPAPRPAPRRAAPSCPALQPLPLPPLTPLTPFLPQAGDAVLAQSQDGATPRLPSTTGYLGPGRCSALVPYQLYGQSKGMLLASPALSAPPPPPPHATLRLLKPLSLRHSPPHHHHPPLCRLMPSRGSMVKASSCVRCRAH